MSIDKKNIEYFDMPKAEYSLRVAMGLQMI